MTKKLFGTDGVRGIANTYPMTAEVALNIGRAVAHLFKKEKHRTKIIIGKDTRISGYMLEEAIVSGICSMGADAYIMGPLPTPGVSFMALSQRADAGIVISASHNPYHDNGIKIFSGDGFKLPDEREKEIENFFFNDTLLSMMNHVIFKYWNTCKIIFDVILLFCSDNLFFYGFKFFSRN